MLMVEKLISVVIELKRFPPVNSHPFSIRWSCEVYDELHTLYLHLQKTHEHKLDKALAYSGRLPSLKSHDSLIR